jgi:hypothetical protein
MVHTVILGGAAKSLLVVTPAKAGVQDILK